MDTSNLKAVRTKELTPEERVVKCASLVEAALNECGCRMYTALKVGHADSPLGEVGGFPVTIKIAINDPKA